MVSDKILWNILIDLFFQVTSLLHSLFDLHSLFFFFEFFQVEHPQIWKGAEVIDRVVETCSRNIRIVLFWFCHNVLASNLNCSQLSLFHPLLLLTLLLLFLLHLLIILSFLLDELLYFCKFLLRGPHVMVGTSVRAFVALILCFLFIVFDSFFDLINFLFLVLQIRVVRNHLSALSLSLTMIRLMVPLVTRFKTSFPQHPIFLIFFPNSKF